METTEGTLLGGRVRYRQPRDGYRTGIEPVLLAASVPAQAGQVVIEAGTGAGAGLLCLAARVAGVVGVGVEVDPGMAELARANIAGNGFAGLSVVTGDVAGVVLPMADHAMANPPWHDRRSTASPVGRRRVAKQESGEGIEAWVAALGRVVREGGTVTMILPAALCERWAVGCAAAGLGEVVRHRLVPRAGRAAKLVLVQAVRGERRHDALHTVAPGLDPGAHGASGAALDALGCRVKPGNDESSDWTVLHGSSGGYTPEVEAVLRDGAALPLG